MATLVSKWFFVHVFGIGRAGWWFFWTALRGIMYNGAMSTMIRTLLMLLAFLGLCGFYVLEKRRNQRALRSFLAVIHVNGIRGKTSVCRMLDAVLRQRYRVLTKTTGSDPRILDVAGNDRAIPRLGPANISEQLRTLRRASRERAQIVIIECMATRPDLQEISQAQIVQGSMAVITNVRLDHILDMGATKDEIAVVLAATIPQKGTLYTADAEYYPYFAREADSRGSHAVLCAQDPGGHENESIVRAIAAALNVPEEAIDEGLAHIRPDIGMRSLCKMRNAKGEPCTFLNLFAANDPLSAWQRLQTLSEGFEEICFVYHNRWDRPDRALLFAQHFFPKVPQARVFLLGDDRPLAQRLFLKHTPTLTLSPAPRWEACLDIPSGSLLVGLGNIKGEATRMLDAFQREEGMATDA